MALTPYIWALWQTKSGRVLIIGILILLFIYVFKWWTIPIVAFIALAVYLNILQDRKEHKKKLKELDDEFNRLQEYEKNMKRKENKIKCNQRI